MGLSVDMGFFAIIGFKALATALHSMIRLGLNTGAKHMTFYDEARYARYRDHVRNAKEAQYSAAAWRQSHIANAQFAPDVRERWATMFDGLVAFHNNMATYYKNGGF